MGISLSKYPNIAVIISSFFWGTYWIPIRKINEGGNESIWPIILAFIILSILLIKTLVEVFKRIFKKKDIYFLLGNFFVALAIALYSESFLRGEIAEVILLFYLCPVWGTILARILLKQKFNFQRYLSLILGIVGLEIILGIDKGYFLPSSIVEWMALLAGFAWALGITFFHLSKPSKVIYKTALTGLFLPFIFFIISFIPEGRELSFSNEIFSSNSIIIWIILFSILWLLPSMYFTYMGAEMLDPGRISILLMFEVIIGITSAAILTDEVIGLREIIGAIFIISAGVIELIKIKT